MSARPQLAPISLSEDQTRRKTWRLQVHSARGAEEALFASRHDAVEEARVLIGDYGHAISITLFDPQGTTETLQGFAFTTRSGS